MSLIDKDIPRKSLALGVNRVITYLALSDFFIIFGWGLVNPIFAVFVTQQVKGAGVEAVGLASTIYFLLKSGLQVPLANIIDRIRGERDDFLAMVVGSLIMATVPIFYIFVKNVPQLFLVQAIYGIGSAISYPSWLALFTRHIDKNKEGWEWSLYYTTIDLSGAGAAAIGGYLAKYLGFHYLFILISLLILLGIIFLYQIRNEFKSSSK
jgi:MFS family permease